MWRHGTKKEDDARAWSSLLTKVMIQFAFRLTSSSERYRAVAHTRGRANGGDGCRDGGYKCLPQDFLPSRFYFAHSSLGFGFS